jgi:BioD-like phosphotransacetylase family protein
VLLKNGQPFVRLAPDNEKVCVRRDLAEALAKTNLQENARLTYSHKYGSVAPMKTTLEIPDTVFRRAKSVAAQRGIPLREFVTEAVKDKLAANAKANGRVALILDPAGSPYSRTTFRFLI